MSLAEADRCGATPLPTGKLEHRGSACGQWICDESPTIVCLKIPYLGIQRFERFSRVAATSN
jgi:hypothetical protein